MIMKNSHQLQPCTFQLTDNCSICFQTSTTLFAVLRSGLKFNTKQKLAEKN